MGQGKQECDCNCNKEPIMASGLAHDEMPVEGIHYNGPIANIPELYSVKDKTGLKYDADYHPIKTSKISDIVIKEMDYGYLVKIGCQTLCIETQTKLNRWLQEYIADPQKITKRWNDGYYHFSKADEMRIGVIAKDNQDFIEWSKQFPSKIKSRDTMRKFTIHVVNEEQEHSSIEYYCLASINAFRGLTLDRIVETNCARENPDFHVIVDGSKVYLKPEHND